MSPVASGGPPHSRSTSANVGGPVGTDSSVRIGGMDNIKGNSRTYPHIDDLTSVRPDVNINSPIRKILQEAELLAKQADTHLDFRRPELALQEYLKASILAAEIIPRHKGYPDLQSNQGDLHRAHTGLLKRIKGQDAKFDIVINAIKEDNLRSGVLPTHTRQSGPRSEGITSIRENGHARAPSLQTAVVNGNSNGARNHDHDSVSGLLDTPSSAANGVHTRKKPPVQPKPDALHGKALPVSSEAMPSSQVDLAARFAKLRRIQPQNAQSAIQDSRIRTQPITIPNSSQTLLQSPSSATSGKPYTTTRSNGPRELPSAPTSIPRSPKIILDVHIPEMPKPPDPIYSPASITDSTATNNLPSSISRASSYLSNGRSNAAPPVSKVGRTPSISSIADSPNDYFSAAHKVDKTSTKNGTKRPIDMPNDIYVSAEALFDYLGLGSQKLRLLLVDLRSREEFDAGHIMAQSIICLEPITLREGMSADQLRESIVLSPDAEQELYEKRHDFDIVVFYDQSSSSIKPHPSATLDNRNYLQYFSKAVYDYGYEKQLKRRPMLLVGGLDAWVDLMGPRSLKASPTESRSSATSSLKPVRPLGRVTIPRDFRRHPQRSAVRVSRPFSKEEEKKWDETLKRDLERKDDLAAQDSGSEEFSYARTTEDFFRKYPELPSIQESMVSTHPPPAIHDQMDHLDAGVPRPPARPAPALPRQRSSGISERGPTATYAMSSASTLITATSVKGLTGLFNFNAKTCYLNSVMQSLSASAGIRHFLFNEYAFKGPNTPVPPKKPIEYGPSPQLLTRNLQLLLRNLWTGRYADLTPTHFVEFIKDLSIKALPPGDDVSKCFGNITTQHDAQEFYTFLFEAFLDELNQKRDQPQYGDNKRNPQRPDIQTLPAMQACIFEWERYQRSNQSRLVDTYTGLSVTCTECRDCPYTNKVWSEFYSKEIYFPDDVKGGTANLKDLFEYNFGISNLDETWKCERCKGNRGKQWGKLAYLPEYLTLYFVRTGAGGSKINTQIRLDLDNVDLRPAHITSHPGVQSEGSLPGFQIPPMYQAYSLVMHKGTTTNSGHYVALTRNLDAPVGMSSRQWHVFDDTNVEPRKLSEQEGKEFQLALLFLRRKGAR